MLKANFPDFHSQAVGISFCDEEEKGQERQWKLEKEEPRCLEHKDITWKFTSGIQFSLSKLKKKTEMRQCMDRADFTSPLYSILAMRSWDVMSPLVLQFFKPVGWTRIVVPILTEQQNHPRNFLKLFSSSYLTCTSENCLFHFINRLFILGLPSFHNSLIYIYLFHSLSSYPVDFVSLRTWVIQYP